MMINVGRNYLKLGPQEILNLGELELGPQEIGQRAAGNKRSG